MEAPNNKCKQIVRATLLAAASMSLLVTGCSNQNHKQTEPMASTGEQVPSGSAPLPDESKIAGHQLFGPLGGYIKFNTDKTAEVHSEFSRIEGHSVGNILGNWHMLPATVSAFPTVRVEYDWQGSRRFTDYTLQTVQGRQGLFGSATDKVTPEVLYFPDISPLVTPTEPLGGKVFVSEWPFNERISLNTDGSVEVKTQDGTDLHPGQQLKGTWHDTIADGKRLVSITLVDAAGREQHALYRYIVTSKESSLARSPESPSYLPMLLGEREVNSAP